MMMTYRHAAAAALLLLSCAAAPAQTWQSTLQARDANSDGTVDAFYDTTLDITWLADWAYSSHGLASGAWSDAAANVATFSYFGATDWRLPAVFREVDEAGIGSLLYTDSEIGHLYGVTLGLAPEGCAVYGCVGDDAPAWYGVPIRNIWVWDSYVVDATFESGVLPPFATENPWLEFSMGGFGGSNGYSSNLLPTGMTIAVHDGDVYAHTLAVPEPSTYALMAGGLLAVGAMARRRKRAGTAG